VTSLVILENATVDFLLSVYECAESLFHDLLTFASSRLADEEAVWLHKL